MLISFPLKCFFFNLHLLKAIKLHPYRTKVQWVITNKVLNSKIYVATCFFSIPTISTIKIYENLAVSIGSTSETFNQSYSNDFDSSEAPTFLGCFKLPEPPAVRRPQTITCAAVRALQAGQKAIRGVFGLKHLYYAQEIYYLKALIFSRKR